MISLLRKFDIYGDNISLYSDQNKKVNTILGGIFTLVIGAISIALFFTFGSDFLYRLNPEFIKNDVIMQDYTKTYFNSSTNYSLTFRFEDNTGNLIDPEGKHFYFSIYHYTYKNINGSFILESQKQIDYNFCRLEDFEDKEFFEKNNMGSYFCISDTISLGGSWSNDFLDYLEISTVRCNEGEINLKGERCGDSKTTNTIISNFAYKVVNMQKLFIDPNNYNTPLIPTKRMVYNRLDSILYKETITNLMSVEVHTDYGWIFSNIIMNSKLDLYNVEVDTSTQDSLKDGQYSNLLDSTYLYYLKDKTIYKRTYSKIQKLLAEIGGIIKFMSVVGTSIIGFYKTSLLEFELVALWITGNLENKVNKTSTDLDNLSKLNISIRSNRALHQNYLKSFKLTSDKSKQSPQIGIKKVNEDRNSFHEEHYDFLLQVFHSVVVFENKITRYLMSM